MVILRNDRQLLPRAYPELTPSGASMKLTKRAIDAIVPDARRDIYVWDK
jgi:hypothetical protein